MEFQNTIQCGHYSNKQQILLVGEGDFSFSLCLAKAFGSATNITATSLDSLEELQNNYKDAKSNVEELVRRGCKVVHGVNVHLMNTDHLIRGVLYDRIIFNFPNAGFDFGRERDSYTISRHQEVVRGFMRSARVLVKDEDKGGEIHVVHKTEYPFSEWKLKTLGDKEGLDLIREVEFSLNQYPGYYNKRGSGGYSDSSFPVGKSSTFISQNSSFIN
ncbi:unnamed protein product [Cochlearia groenlandica]